MPAIKLPPFAPDIASVDTAVSGVARNVFPRADGYGPVPSPAPISLPLPDECRGIAAVTSPLFGTWIYFAGTRTKLYRFDPTSTSWTDVSGSRTYSVPEGDSWQFALYGSRLVAVHLGAPPQVMDIDRDRTFRDLGGNPPRARAVGIVNEFLVLAGLGNQPNAIQWSDLGDIEFWTPGLRTAGHTADIQVFPEGGEVTGFSGGEYGVVFQERSIRRLTFSPGSLEVFDTSIVEENRGCVAPWALMKVGPRTFFLDRDGFYAFAGGISTPIGAERVNRTFLNRIDLLRLFSTIAVRDVYGPRVIFCYRTKAADPAKRNLLDAGLVYDWQLDRWAEIDIAVQAGQATATPPASLDALPGTVDDEGAPSWDDPIYAGGVPALGFVTADRRLSLLTGPPLEAALESADAMLARPARGFARGVRLDSDADDWRARVGTRETLRQTEAVRWRSETAPNHERFAPCRASGRYHRIGVRVPAGTAWSYASGVEVDATAEGMR